MAGATPSYVIVNPSFVEPGIILPYVQASGAFSTLAGEEPLVRLGDGDLYVYMKRLDVRTRMAAGQAAYNMLPSVSIALSMISTASYLLRVRAEYDHHDTAAMGKWGLNMVEAQRLGMRQGHFQLARNALLYGLNPVNGEGLLNAQGAVSVPLPPDSNGNDTIVTYDMANLAYGFSRKSLLSRQDAISSELVAILLFLGRRELWRLWNTKISSRLFSSNAKAQVL
jgi:hypothetical protein